MKQVERAVVLAAGLGTRLKWLTNDRPKALMQVAGEPAIAHVVRRLVSQGVKNIAVNAHHHGQQLEAYLGDGARFGCRIVMSYEPELLDSGGGVRQALTLLAGEGPVAVHNADVLADVDVQTLAAHLPEGGASVALVPNPPYNPRGDFALHHGRLSLAEEGRHTFAGVSVWHPTAFDGYAAGEIFSLVQPFQALIERGLCRGLLYQGRWYDIGRPGDLMRANREFGHRHVQGRQREFWR